MKHALVVLLALVAAPAAAAETCPYLSLTGSRIDAGDHLYDYLTYRTHNGIETVCGVTQPHEPGSYVATCDSEWSFEFYYAPASLYGPDRGLLVTFSYDGVFYQTCPEAA
jgi:hypothetical protein